MVRGRTVTTRMLDCFKCVNKFLKDLAEPVRVLCNVPAESLWKELAKITTRAFLRRGRFAADTDVRGLTRAPAAVAFAVP